MQATETPVRKTTSTVRGKTYTRYVVVYRDEAGKRKRKAFSALAPARRYAEQVDRDNAQREERKKILSQRIGVKDAGKLSADNLRDALDALAVLEGHGTLTEAARHYTAFVKQKARDIPTVGELAERYIADAADLRPASIRELKHRLGRLGRQFGSKRVDEVEATEVSKWLRTMRRVADGKPMSHTSREHYRFCVGGLFNYAIELGHIETNPAAARSRGKRGKVSRKVESPPPAIFTPAEARKLLFAAREHVPEIVPALAIGMFAGVRTAELRRLTWEKHIDLSRGLVMISNDIAKKRQVRNVEILPNLARWLAAVPNRKGLVVPLSVNQWQDRMDKVRGLSGLATWPYNGMRHSFGSYHLEHFGDAAKTALQMGHADRGGLLFEHYRQVVTRESAAEFWKIDPPGEAGVLMMDSGKAAVS